MQKKNDWFFQCTEELKFPGNSWLQVSNLVAERLANRIKIEGLTHDQLNVVSKFVGEDFIKKHQLDKKLDYAKAKSLPAKFVSDEEIQKLLKNLTLKAAKDAQCSLPQDSSSEKCFIDLIDNIKQIFLSKQQKLIDSDSSESFDLPYTTKEKRIESLSHTVIEILQQDASKVDDVLSSLKGRLMPGCLRKYLYRLLLLKRKKQPSPSTAVGSEVIISSNTMLNQKKIRENFAAGVKTGMLQMKIQNPVDSPISHLIRSTVVETFDTNSGIASFSNNASMQQDMCRVLNILYTKTQVFEYVNVLWLLPLQVSLSKDSFAKENDIELAMWLDLFITEMVPSWDAVNEIVCATWFKAVKFSHVAPFQDLNLKMCLSSLGVTLEPDEVRMLLQRNNPFVYSRQASSVRLQSPTILNSTTHPAILIRQWLLHLFVGCTTLRTTLFVWDQLFIHNWSEACLKRVCLTLILCIAKHIVACKNKAELFSVFQGGLNDIELVDVVKAWKQINELLPL